MINSTVRIRIRKRQNTGVALEGITPPRLTECLFQLTCDGIGAQAGTNVPLNGYEACGQGGGRGLNQEAGDELGLGAPRQGNGGVVHVGDTDAARRADVWGLDEVVRSGVKPQHYMQINRQSSFPQRLTLHSGDLLVHRPAGQRVFQGVKVDLVGCCNLSETIKRTE